MALYQMNLAPSSSAPPPVWFHNFYNFVYVPHNLSHLFNNGACGCEEGRPPERIEETTREGVLPIGGELFVRSNLKKFSSSMLALNLSLNSNTISKHKNPKPILSKSVIREGEKPVLEETTA